MFGQNDYSNLDEASIQEESEKEQPVEYNLSINNNQKSAEELIQYFHQDEMDENDLYEMVLNNKIAHNLYQSLTKLKKGSDKNKNLFNYPFQIKVYPKSKLMVIYLVISHHFLRIKTELILIKENPKYKKPTESELKKAINSNSSKDSQESQIMNNEESKKEKEIIFTLNLINFYNMLDLLLTENKDYPLLISIDINFSIIKGRAVCPDVYNQTITAATLRYDLIKNEVFAYKITPPEEPKYYEPKLIKKNFFNDINNEKSDSSNIIINNNQSQSISQKNALNDEEYLEKKFKTDEKCAKYMIEGRDLIELYTLMKGLESFCLENPVLSLGISMDNSNALLYRLAYENIKNTKSIKHISKNIRHMTMLKIKSVKDHSCTPFKHGFNSFYRIALISKFITSFYNKDDKRLLVKVSPSGKMILSFTFSAPMMDMSNNDIGISTEINENLNENENKINKMFQDPLIDDENAGNIVEMIFYPNVFQLCKS